VIRIDPKFFGVKKLHCFVKNLSSFLTILGIWGKDLIRSFLFMTKAIIEVTIFEGIQYQLSWLDTLPDLSNSKISQISGFVMTDTKEVLIIKNKHGWGIPGGHPEKEDKNIFETLQREVYRYRN
jgi:NUDIX domain